MYPLYVKMKMIHPEYKLMQSLLDNENRKCCLGQKCHVERSDACQPLRIETDLDAFCIQCARVVGSWYLRALYSGSEFVLVVRVDMECGPVPSSARERPQTRAARRGRREGEHRCACYSSRFLSPRNALAIIVART